LLRSSEASNIDRARSNYRQQAATQLDLEPVKITQSSISQEDTEPFPVLKPRDSKRREAKSAGRRLAALAKTLTDVEKQVSGELAMH
jgi:hypothetical protein